MLPPQVRCQAAALSACTQIALIASATAASKTCMRSQCSLASTKALSSITLTPAASGLPVGEAGEAPGALGKVHWRTHLATWHARGTSAAGRRGLRSRECYDEQPVFLFHLGPNAAQALVNRSRIQARSLLSASRVCAYCSLRGTASIRCGPRSFTVTRYSRLRLRSAGSSA